MQARADDDGAARTLGPQLCNQGRHRRRWCTNHRQIGHARKRGHIRPHQLPANAGALRIYEPDRPFETRALQVIEDQRAQAVGLV
jgi:hypothetical protein